MLYPLRGGKNNKKIVWKVEKKVKIVSNKEKGKFQAMWKNKDTRGELERREREVAAAEKNINRGYWAAPLVCTPFLLGTKIDGKA